LRHGVVIYQQLNRTNQPDCSSSNYIIFADAFCHFANKRIMMMMMIMLTTDY